MPRGDRTGPQGAGPLSGRGAGYCGGGAPPGPGAGPWGGGGWGGRGRGWRNRFFATGEPGWAAGDADEKQALENRAGWLSRQLDAIRERLRAIDSKNE